MRVTAVAIFAEEEEIVRFAMRGVQSRDRYQIRQIVGMDADEMTPRFYGFGQSSKKKFYDFGMKPRSLVIRTHLNPTFALNEEHAHIRDELYKAISANRSGIVNIRFYSGGSVVAKLYGFIVKLEAGYFNKTPEAQLTIRCDDPLYRSLAPVRLTGSDIPPVNPLRLADATSTAPHGFAACINITSTIPDFTIQEREINPDWYFNVVPDDGFIAGDKIFFSSDTANKYLYRDRSGVITHLIDKIEPGSMWPIIFPGGNDVYFVDWGDFTIDYVEYYAAFWGV